MTQTLILTASGPDRPGLIEALARVVEAHGGNWLDSRMARLADRFAGIAILTLPVGALPQLELALAELESLGMSLCIDPAGAVPPAEAHAVRLELMGHDRPGVLHEITELLAAQGVSIETLVTRITSASWSGEAMFAAELVLRLPEGLSTEALRGLIEALANELMVDMAFESGL